MLAELPSRIRGGHKNSINLKDGRCRKTASDAEGRCCRRRVNHEMGSACVLMKGGLKIEARVES